MLKGLVQLLAEQRLMQKVLLLQLQLIVPMLKDIIQKQVASIHMQRVIIPRR